MTTIGDSFSVVAVLGGICLSAWALMLAVALVFPNKAHQAENRMSTRPWLCLFLGLLIWLTFGTFSVALISSPVPGVKLVGWGVLMTILSIAAVGSSGSAMLASRRLKRLDPDITPYAALSKSAAFIVIAGLLPVLGWFLIVPLLLCVSTGAGLTALKAREPMTEAPSFMQ